MPLMQLPKTWKYFTSTSHHSVDLSGLQLNNVIQATLFLHLRSLHVAEFFIFSFISSEQVWVLELHNQSLFLLYWIDVFFLDFLFF